MWCVWRSCVEVTGLKYSTSRQNAFGFTETLYTTRITSDLLWQIILSYVVQSNTSKHRWFAPLFVKPLPCLQAKDTVSLRHIHGVGFSFPWRYTGALWFSTNIKNKYINIKYKHPLFHYYINNNYTAAISFLFNCHGAYSVLIVMD